MECGRMGLCFSALLAASSIGPLFSGCADDLCLSQDPAFQVDLILGSGVDGSTLEKITVDVRVGGLQKKAKLDLARLKANGRASFDVTVGKTGAAGFTANILVEGQDDQGKVIVRAQQYFSASGDACNFFEMPLGARLDAGPPDGCVSELGHPLDGCTPAPDMSVVPQKCGDAVINTGEQCDGTKLGGKTCVALGFDDGTLKCKNNCRYDYSACNKCGDGKISGSEQCDGLNLNKKTCKDEGHVGGTLTCSNCKLDTTACHSCGNSKIDTNEDCDKSTLPAGKKTCADFGYLKGTPSCGANCKLTGCFTCGDGVLSTGNEDCDTKDFGKQTCATKGYSGGVLTCDSKCKVDTAVCYKLSDPTGIAISTGSADQWYPSVTFDGAKNFFISWTAIQTNWNIYGARLDSAKGTVLDPSGIAIATATKTQWYSGVAFDAINKQYGRDPALGDRRCPVVPRESCVTSIS